MRLGNSIATSTGMLRNDYAQAFETGYSSTRRFLLSRGAAVEDAEEIAQAAWARGWEYRDQLRDPGLVGYWVNSIARNLFRARFRMPVQTAIEETSAVYSMDMDELELQHLLERCSHRDRK